MARLETNRSGEMEVFVRVIELGGFTAAARACRMTPSAVSKLVARLEARLGARLVARSTRRLQLTPEGCGYYERAVRVLADLDEAERTASAGERPTGRVRLSTSASFGVHLLSPLVPAFLALHPGVTLDITHTDAIVDLVEERVDVAIRVGPLKSSRLLARKLGTLAMTIVGAPAYLARVGEPRSADDLEGHDRLWCTSSVDGWPVRTADGIVMVPAAGSVKASDGEALRHLALAGAGLARLPAFTVEADIRAGRLRPVLEDLNPGDRKDVHAVYLGQGGPLPARVRVLLDFLAERARVV